jgi:hypothetical protein
MHGAFSCPLLPLRPLIIVIVMSGNLVNDVERGPEGEPVIISPFFLQVLIAVRLVVSKAGTIEMVQIDPLKNPMNRSKTLTIVLMICGHCSESKLRAMMKHGQRL